MMWAFPSNIVNPFNIISYSLCSVVVQFVLNLIIVGETEFYVVVCLVDWCKTQPFAIFIVKTTHFQDYCFGGFYYLFHSEGVLAAVARSWQSSICFHAFAIGTWEAIGEANLILFA